MKRIASHFLFQSPQVILRRYAIELDDLKRINSIFSIESEIHETAHTQFYDGILSLSHISIKQRFPEILISEKFVSKFQHIDLSNLAKNTGNSCEKQMVIDFGTEKPTEIVNILLSNLEFLESISIFELLAASIYFPRMAAGIDAEPMIERDESVILWTGINLVDKMITPNVKIQSLSEL
jgi:hypothetical protein